MSLTSRSGLETVAATGNILGILPKEVRKEPAITSFSAKVGETFSRGKTEQDKDAAKKEGAESKDAAQGKLEWTDLAENGLNDVSYEYSLHHPTGGEFEATRVLIGKDGLHSMRYHFYRSEVSALEKQSAEQFIQSISIKDLQSGKSD